MGPVRRRVNAAAVLAVVPVFLSSLIVVSLVGELVLPQRPWLVPLVWVLSAAVVFVRPAEAAMAWLLGARRPTASQERRLAPAWYAVCRRAGVDGRRYALRVEESDLPMATTAGARTVSVTTGALRLPPPLLTAVVAHEFGHHASGHSTLSMLAWWYALPARGVGRLVLLGARLVAWVWRSVDLLDPTRDRTAPRSRLGSGLGLVAATLMAFTMLMLLAALNLGLLLLPLIAPLLAWASRMAEHRADEIAARLGYGPELAEVLAAWQRAEGDYRPTWRDRLFARHPVTGERIARLYQGAGHR